MDFVGRKPLDPDGRFLRTRGHRVVERHDLRMRHRRTVDSSLVRCRRIPAIEKRFEFFETLRQTTRIAQYLVGHRAHPVLDREAADGVWQQYASSLFSVRSIPQHSVLRNIVPIFRRAQRDHHRFVRDPWRTVCLANGVIGKLRPPSPFDQTRAAACRLTRRGPTVRVPIPITAGRVSRHTTFAGQDALPRAPGPASRA